MALLIDSTSNFIQNGSTFYNVLFQRYRSLVIEVYPFSRKCLILLKFCWHVLTVSTAPVSLSLIEKFCLKFCIFVTCGWGWGMTLIVIKLDEDIKKGLRGLFLTTTELRLPCHLKCWKLLSRCDFFIILIFFRAFSSLVAAGRSHLDLLVLKSILLHNTEYWE